MLRYTAVAGAVILLVGAASPGERVFKGDPVIATTVAGVPGRLRIDPGAPSSPIIDGAFAARAKLKGGMIAFAYDVGPVSLYGATAVSRIDFGSGPVKRRIGWTNRSYSAGVDGAVGPGGLPEPVIRYILRSPMPGERTVALPMVDGGGVFGGRMGLFALIEVGGTPLRIRFDLGRPRTLATAGAAQRIANAFGGQFTGKSESAEIAFGIERPVRRMTLARSLSVGPLAFTAIDVRTADFGRTNQIAEVGAVDPDEIVVTARGKRDESRDRLTIGAGALARCSSLVFDKPKKQIRLSCR